MEPIEPVKEVITYSDGSEKVIEYVSTPEETIVSESLKEDEEMLETPESLEEISLGEDPVEQTEETA